MNTLTYPEGLPLPLRDYNINKPDSFKAADSGYLFKSERITRKFNIIDLRFIFSKDEYIEFTDFFLYSCEEGFLPFILTIDIGDGNVQKAKGEVQGGLKVKIEDGSRFEISCSFIIKDDTIRL